MFGVSLSRAWLLLGCFSLILSGVLSLPMLMGKAPFFRDFVNVEWIRWSLVIHVSLSNVIWFTAIPMGLIQKRIEELLGRQKVFFVHKIGFFISLGGLLLILTSFLGKESEAVLSNYIPVISGGQFELALAIYFSGLVISLLASKAVFTKRQDTSTDSAFDRVGFGLGLGGIFLISSFGVFLWAYCSVSSSTFYDLKVFYEQITWGGGHLLQHASSVFLVCVWAILLSWSQKSILFSRKELFLFFAWLGVPLFVVPILLFFPVYSAEYREGFTVLMQWGIAPPMLVLLIQVFKKMKASSATLERPLLHDHCFLAFSLSAWLLVLGFIFGAFIRGPDLRIPAHYHATIGAVTIAFMGIATSMLFEPTRIRKWFRVCLCTYGFGQTVFASGMFVAGFFGVQRKTYGSELELLHFGQKIGFALFAVGGLIALLGGFLFAWHTILALKLFNKSIKRRPPSEGRR